jgi:excisionase family DNA binding protein
MDTMTGAASAPGGERLVYSVAEAGALLGISRAFAYELVARGELPVIRLGPRRLVPKAALNALAGAEPAVQIAGEGSIATDRCPQECPQKCPHPRSGLRKAEATESEP